MIHWPDRPPNPSEEVEGLPLHLPVWVLKPIGPAYTLNPPTPRSACARLDSMSVSQSQTESGGLVGSSSRALLIPPGGGGGVWEGVWVWGVGPLQHSVL